jgi:hypothetical protein
VPLTRFTATTDFRTNPNAAKAQQVKAWHLAQGGVNAQTVNFRDGALAGPVLFQVQLPINGSKGLSYPTPITFPNGLTVEVVNANFVVGSVDFV